MASPEFQLEDKVHHFGRGVNGMVSKVSIVTDAISSSYILYDIMLFGDEGLSTLVDVPERFLLPGHRQIIE